jgi:hypothetical protein
MKERSRKISGPSPYRKPTFSNRTKLSSARLEPWQETPDLYQNLNPNLYFGLVARWFGYEPDKTVLRPLWFPIR